jgi:hypothetical protein
MYERVQRAAAWEAEAREKHGGGNSQRQPGADGACRHPQGEQDRLPLIVGKSQGLVNP